MYSVQLYTVYEEHMIIIKNALQISTSQNMCWFSRTEMKREIKVSIQAEA